MDKQNFDTTVNSLFSGIYTTKHYLQKTVAWRTRGHWRY